MIVDTVLVAIGLGAEMAGELLDTIRNPDVPVGLECAILADSAGRMMIHAQMNQSREAVEAKDVTFEIAIIVNIETGSGKRADW